MKTTEDTLAKIAKEQMQIETLETRNHDALDFHTVAVWEAKSALQAAYDAGQAELLAAAEALVNENDQVSESVGHYKQMAECWRRLRRAIRHAKKQNALPKP